MGQPAIAALALGLLLAGSMAHAQDSPEQYLRQFDRDGNGRVSETEYVAYMSRGFEQMDRNHDGILETDELPGGHGRAITLRAFQDNLRGQFHRLDRHHHGYLNARELTAPPR